MGASSSGLLDETKINQVKGLVESSLQHFSAFYQQQYAVAYFGHLHQEVEPKKEGRGLLLTRRPQCAPEEVLYQSSVRFSCWDEPGKKCRERFAVLRRDHSVEIHDNMEAFNRGGTAKFVLQPAGASVFTTEEESRAHLEKTCAGILNGVKEDSSSVVPSADASAVYLHLPYRGHACFLFQQAEERDRFLSAIQTCIRHRNLDPWLDSSYESRAFARALRLYRQDKGCYKSWEMLLGTEEQVLASQVMEEVLPWLQTQLQSRVKGKKGERMRQWLATVQATYALVLEQLSASLEALREECRQTAAANQALIRSNLDQIVSSHSFLEQKVRDCVRDGAEKVCGKFVAPYTTSILEVLTQHVNAGIAGMQEALHARMDAALSGTQGGAEELKEALSSVSLDRCYREVETLAEKLEDLKERFGLNSTRRLIHSAQLEMEQLLDGAVYTFQQYLRASARQLSKADVKTERAKARVLKQLDHDSRLVQRRLYEEALLEVTLPCVTRQMDNKWRTELQQFEQYIFSDYSSFILVHNVYDDVLKDVLRQEITRAVQDAAGKTSSGLLLDASDLALSQYSLLGGQTPPRSAPGSPAVPARGAADRGQTAEAKPQESPEAVETQQGDEAKNTETIKEESGEVPIRAKEPDAAESEAVCTTAVDAPATTEPPGPSPPVPPQPGRDEPVSSEESPLDPSPHNVPAPQLDESESTAVSRIPPTSEDVQVRTEEPAAASEAAVTRDVGSAGNSDSPPVSPLPAERPVPQEAPDAAPLCPVILVDQSEASCIKQTNEEVRVDLAEPREDVVTPDPLSEVQTPPSESPVCRQTAEVQKPGNHVSTDVSAAETERAQSAAPDSTSDEPSAAVSSVELPPAAAGSSAISLGSLSDAICRDPAETPAAAVQQRTDRAVYLTGEIKNNWLMEKLNQEKEAAGKDGDATEAKRDESEKEEKTGEEGGEEKKEEEESEAPDEGYRSSGSPAESAAAERREEEELEGGVAKEDGAPEPPLDSVAAIRDLVMEVTEVETVITPRPAD